MNLYKSDDLESGETMKAAGLKDIDTVVESTAILIKSKNPSHPALVDLITARIRGVVSKWPCSQCDPHCSSSSSPAEVCTLSLQRTPRQAADYVQDHARQKGTHHHTTGRRRLGCRQFHGGEEKDCQCHGRLDSSRSDRHFGVGHCECQGHLIIRSTSFYRTGYSHVDRRRIVYSTAVLLNPKAVGTRCRRRVSEARDTFDVTAFRFFTLSTRTRDAI